MDAFKALASPQRRDIIELLGNREKSISQLSSHFKISRQGISKHIFYLRDCGVVSTQKDGRETICSVKKESLNEVMSWMNNYHSFWQSKLDSLEDYLNEI
jgi:DNA-binding transcriptional ArsR family regulator